MEKSIELVITGWKVCDVGYGPFLLLNVMKLGIRNFYPYNISEGREERVVAQLYGDEDKINRCIDFISCRSREDDAGSPSLQTGKKAESSLL
jgi:hypothetical protein